MSLACAVAKLFSHASDAFFWSNSQRNLAVVLDDLVLAELLAAMFGHGDPMRLCASNLFD